MDGASQAIIEIRDPLAVVDDDWRGWGDTFRSTSMARKGKTRARIEPSWTVLVRAVGSIIKACLSGRSFLYCYGPLVMIVGLLCFRLVLLLPCGWVHG